jgi:ABC-type transport system involved in multi-copper enzyme maturation permease subunit
MNAGITGLATGDRVTTPSSWLAHTWRLTVWNLFAARRRTLSKWLLAIFFGLYVLIHLLTLLSVAVSSSVSGRVAADSGAVAFFTFPMTIAFAGAYTDTLGVLLLATLAGALVGGEYGSGTVRVVLSRGVGRGQMITAQAFALALLAFGGTAIMLLLGGLVSLIIGPALGGVNEAIPAGGWAQLLQYWFAVSLGPYAFALLALFMATLARSTAAGIAVPLGYWVLEGIAASIIIVIGLAIGGQTGAFIFHIPDWLLGINTGILTSRIADGPLYIGLGPRSLSQVGNQISPQGALDGAHALLVVLTYIALFVVGSYLVLRRRDVTD